MDASEEMKKWVASLSIAEKRFVKLLSKARGGGTDSQQIAYFDWLNQAAPDDLVPSNSKFANNLPTVSNRLKDLILDALRLLNKETSIDAQLRTTLDEIAILRQKDLQLALSRQLRRAKKVAMEHSRYTFALQCVKIEQQIAQANARNVSLETLQTLRLEELEILKRQSDLHELEYLHSTLQARAAQILVPRGQSFPTSPSEFSQNRVVLDKSESGNYLEQALAVNILGIANLLEGNPMIALPRYELLLQAWRKRPDWQNDQGPLLFFICNCYQSICFCCPLKIEELQARLAQLPDFQGLPPEVGRDFQRLLFHNKFNFALNLGQLDGLPVMIDEIDQWITAQADHLTEARILPFWHNFLMAEFIRGDFAQAKRRVQRILNLPNRKVRNDIRDFALVMQAVLQYEMGESGLDEYLLRAGKRYFKKYARDLDFELAVYAYLEKTLQTDTQVERAAIEQLIAQLDALTENVATAIPILGLMEMKLWAKARLQRKPLREVFLEAVQVNLAHLG